MIPKFMLIRLEYLTPFGKLFSGKENCLSGFGFNYIFFVLKIQVGAT